jgi:hypothetical protein
MRAAPTIAMKEMDWEACGTDQQIGRRDDQQREAGDGTGTAYSRALRPSEIGQRSGLGPCLKKGNPGAAP